MSIKKVVSTKYVDGESGLDYLFEPINEEVVIQKTKTGYEARYVVADDNPISPDEDKDDGLFLVHYHRDFYMEREDKIAEDEARRFYQGAHIDQEKDFWLFPVSALIHSGVWLALNHSFSCDPTGRDTSHVGLILVSKAEAKTKKQAESLAVGLIETWNQYLSNDVYGIVKETYDKDKNQLDHDSVWGFYGLETAKNELKAL